MCFFSMKFSFFKWVNLCVCACVMTEILRDRLSSYPPPALHRHPLRQRDHAGLVTVYCVHVIIA